MKRTSVRKLVCGLFVALTVAVAVPALAADYEIPVVTGEHWQKSTPQERKAFLVGAATIIELEQEVQGTPPAKKSTIDVWAKGLSNFTFDQMVAAIDQWYAANPGKLNRPVVEVMWYELAKPNCPADVLQKMGQDDQTPPPGKKAGKGKTGKTY